MENLKLITMNNIEPEQVTFLWKPYIAFGKITIIQGDPGDGKTTMMLAIAASVTRGDCIADCNDPVIPSDVIFQTAEDGLADTIRPRLEQLGADCSRIHVIDEGEQSLSLIDERIEAAIRKTNAKLLILDPMQAYLCGADMHSVNGIRPLMKKLASFAAVTGAAIVLIGHLNKKGSKSAYRGLGSIDIIAAARSVLTVGRLDLDDNMRAFVQTKSNLAPVGNPQAFELTSTGGFCWLGDCEISVDELLSGKKEDKTNSQLGVAKSFITGLLQKGEISASHIFRQGAEIGLSQITLKRAKSELNISSVKRGCEWFWTNKEAQEYQEAHMGTMIPLTSESEGNSGNNMD